MKRFRFIPFTLALMALILAAQPWQSAKIVETGEDLEINGFAASNGIWLLVALPLLVLFGARYWPPIAANIAAVLALLIGISASIPIFEIGIETNPGLLKSLVASKLGVAEWTSQQELLTDVSTNTAIILGTAIVLTVLSVSNLLSMRKMKK